MITKEQLLESDFKIILGSYETRTEADRQKIQNYIEIIHRTVRDWRPEALFAVVDAIIKSMGRGQKPMPEDFQNAFKSWCFRKGEEARTSVEVCSTCGSTGWAEIEMYSAKMGLKDTFATPCAKCRPNHPFRDAMPRQGWSIDEMQPKSTHEVQLLDMARKMGPKGARFVLDLADKMKVNFSDAVLSELVQKAGDEPAQENKVAELALATIAREPVSREQAANHAEGNPVPMLREEYEVEGE